VTYQGIMDQANKAMAGYDKARILLVPPPVIQGIGAAGGYRFMLQDREGRGYDALNAQAWALIAKANAEAGLQQVYTPVRCGHAARLCRYRPPQGRPAGRAARTHVRGAGGLSRLGLRQ
jgi:hypothetical protein